MVLSVGQQAASQYSGDQEWPKPKDGPSKYRIDRLIGKGAFGQAWLVIDKTSGATKVMKEI
eukprot:gene7470-17443_t